MTASRIVPLLCVVVIMAVGQILFKLAAGRLGNLSLSWDMAARLVFNPYLVVGVMVYGLTTILWVLVLTDTDLSRSYPFVALTMVLVPIAGVFLFNESLSPGLVIGGGLILAGLAVISYF